METVSTLFFNEMSILSPKESIYNAFLDTDSCIIWDSSEERFSEEHLGNRLMNRKLALKTWFMDKKCEIKNLVNGKSIKWKHHQEQFLRATPTPPKIMQCKP